MRWSDVGQEVEGEAAAERGGRDHGQRLIDVRDGLLEAEGEQDDPGDHRQVQVAVEVARELGLRRAARPREQRCVRTARTSKYAHQSAAITTMPRIEADTIPRVSDVRGSHAERDHRLTERDDDDQSVPLGEVGRGDVPALPAADQTLQ